MAMKYIPPAKLWVSSFIQPIAGKLRGRQSDLVYRAVALQVRRWAKGTGISKCRNGPHHEMAATAASALLSLTGNRRKSSITPSP
jgi:hypothetical protein